MPKINESELKKEIKSGDFKNAYLLYGEESYLKEYYANELKNKIVDKTFEAFNFHYFDGKDALMGTLAYVFDEKYEDLMPTLDPEKGAIETLAYINHELYVMIESSVSIDLLTRLLSTQLLARGEKHLLDRSRVYFRLLKKIVRQGAERGEFRPGLAQEEIVRAFAMWERAQLYDWCLCGGDYSLVAYAEKMTPLFLESFRVRE